MSIEHLDFDPEDDDTPSAPEPPEQDAKAKTAAEQGSNYPLAWKPTPKEPVPVVRCTAIKKDGARCGRWSIRGYVKCKSHAGPGALMPDGNVNKYAAAVIEAARLRLVDDSDYALDVLKALTEPGTGEGIRLKAATEILDRAGIRGGFEVEITGDITVSPVDELKKRLTDLKKGADAVEQMKADQLAGDIVDGEVVEEDEQPGLFDLPEEDET